MKSKSEQLIKRGYIEDKQLLKYLKYTKIELLDLLNSKVPSERTISARLLIKYSENDVLDALIDRILIENKLYTKIALSEGIATYGREASSKLINYLGMVGSNQHRELPNKPFKKVNYPLPRDIIARTICKIGLQALESLKDCLCNGDYKQKLEALDAIGFISYYEFDSTLKDEIVEMISQYSNDKLMIWKLLRALQSFDDEKVLSILNKYSDSVISQYRWEAIRSIKQIERRRQNKTNYAEK